MSIQSSDASSCSRPSSFSDQNFKAFGGPALKSTRASCDSDNNAKVGRSTSSNRVARETFTDTGTPTDVYLSTTFISSFCWKDIYDAGKVVIYPKSMDLMLSRKYPEIVSTLEKTYRLGAFIYVGSSFQCLFPRNPQRFQKIKTKFICDMCIFPKKKPVILFTVAKDNGFNDHLINYNLQIKRNLEAWIGEKRAEFKALSAVATLADFQTKGRLESLVTYAARESGTTVLPLTLIQMNLCVEAFLQKLATCKFVQRFHAVPEETLYLVQGLFEDVIELMEETKNRIVYPKSEYKILLVCELAYRLALIGHTSVHSKTEVKNEFEELGREPRISITYGKSVPDENLQEGDILLSSWKGGTITFRTGMTEVEAARRTLASAVVNRSAKMQDKESRNRLVELVCSNIKMTEEQLENTLHGVYSKSQIAKLESLAVSLQDNMTGIISVNNQQTYPMQTVDEERSLPTQKMMQDFKYSTVQQDPYTQSTFSETSQCGNRRYVVKGTKYGLYHADDLDNSRTSNSTDLDEATDIPSAQKSRQTFDEPDDTLHYVHTDPSRTMSVSDPSSLQRWLSMQKLSTDGGNQWNNSQTPSRDPTPFSNTIGRTDSDSTYQREQSFSKQNRNPALHKGEQHFTQQGRNRANTTHHDKQLTSRKPAFTHQSRNPVKQNDTIRTKDQSSSKYVTHTKTSSDIKYHIQLIPEKEQSTQQSKHAYSPSHIPYQDEQRYNVANYAHSGDKDTTRFIREQPVPHSRQAFTHSEIKYEDDQRSRRDTSSHQSGINANYSGRPYRDETRPIIGQHKTRSRGDTDSNVTNKGEQRTSRNYAGTSHLTNQSTSEPTRLQNTGNVSHMELKSNERQSYHQHNIQNVSESRLTSQGTPRATSGDRRSLPSRFHDVSNIIRTDLPRAKSQLDITKAFKDNDIITGPSMGDLSIIPRNIVKRRSIAFQ